MAVAENDTMAHLSHHQDEDGRAVLAMAIVALCAGV